LNRSRASYIKIILLFVCYGIAVAAYVWYTSPHNVPENLIGSAADPATFFTAGQLRDSENLNAMRNWIFFMSGPWEWLIYIILLLTGLARSWSNSLERFNLPIYVRFPVYVLQVSAVSFVLYLPLRVMSYNLSKAYGITTQSALGWLRDKLIAFGISYLTLLAVSAVAFWLISRGGRWWLKLWLISIPFTLFMMVVQPVVIDPIYNKFETLSDPLLEQQILELAAKAHIPAERVYEVNMSEKTNAMNAYVNGLGVSLRIVLWDTTLQRLDKQEVMLIMAHEMAHYVKHHLEWSAFGAIVSTFIMLAIGSVCYRVIVRRWGAGWGIRSLSDMTALPLILLLVSILTFVSLPITNAVSRQAESAADNYAMELIGSAEGSVTMHQKMAVAVLSDVNPPLLVKWFRDSHPTDRERIINAEKFAQRREP
jgi:STE24 endopeptidase